MQTLHDSYALPELQNHPRYRLCWCANDEVRFSGERTCRRRLTRTCSTKLTIPRSPAMVRPATRQCSRQPDTQLLSACSRDCEKCSQNRLHASELKLWRQQHRRKIFELSLKYPCARSPIICVEEKNIWDPDIPLNIPWERQPGTFSSDPYLHSNACTGDQLSQETVPNKQSKPQCNAIRRRTGPVLAWGSPSYRILKPHAKMGLRDPTASGALADHSKKKTVGAKSGLRFQEYRYRNSSLSTPKQPAEDECDFKRSLFVKKLPKIRNLKEQLCCLFEDAGFKPTTITFPSDVGRFRDFGFIEFSSAEIPNRGMLVVDGAKFRER